MLLQELL